MTASEVTALFDQGMELYTNSAPLSEVLPIFKEITQRESKNCAAWTCLSWLYLLNNQPKSALDAAKKAVPLGPMDAQARINLVLAMLENKQKGVREYMEQAIQILGFDKDQLQQVSESINDGLTRKPDWAALKKVQNWLTEAL